MACCCDNVLPMYIHKSQSKRQQLFSIRIAFFFWRTLNVLWTHTTSLIIYALRIIKYLIACLLFGRDAVTRVAVGLKSLHSFELRAYAYRVFEARSSLSILTLYSKSLRGPSNWNYWREGGSAQRRIVYTSKDFQLNSKFFVPFWLWSSSVVVFNFLFL